MMLFGGIALIAVVMAYKTVVGFPNRGRDHHHWNRNETATNESLRDDPNYEAIMMSFPNKSESDLLNLRTKLKSLNDKAVSKLQENPQEPLNVTTNSAFDVVPEVPTPLSIAEINANISEFLWNMDVLLTDQQLEDLTSTNDRKKRAAALECDSCKWPTKGNGVIPYYLDTSLTAQKITVIRQAVQFWMDNACLQFQERDINEPDADVPANYIIFFSGSGCYSYIGMVGGQQELSIGDGCEYLGIATHEIGHALGFFHEQSRYDRDTYVTINMGNVQSGLEGNYAIEPQYLTNVYSVPYDYGSVMHYAYEDFAVNPNIPVIIAADPTMQQTMGQRRAPSFLDILTMNRHYSCDALCTSSTTACQNGGHPDPANCNQCKCPVSFGGPLCATLAPAQNGVCGASLTATTVWQSFSATVGTTSITDTATTCYWQLNSPPNTVMEIQVTLTGGSCNPGCFYNSVEVKLDANYQTTGIRSCCPADPASPYYTSSTNLVPVIVYGNYQTSFVIQYRYVATPVTTTITAPTTTTTTLAPTTPVSTSVTSTVKPSTTTPSGSTTTVVAPSCCAVGEIFDPHSMKCIGWCGGAQPIAPIISGTAWQTVDIELDFGDLCYWPVTGPDCSTIQVNMTSLTASTCNTGCTLGSISFNDNGTPLSPAFCCSTDAPKSFVFTSNNALMITDLPANSPSALKYTMWYRNVPGTCSSTTAPPPFPVCATPTTVAPTTATTPVSTCCPADQLWNPRSNSCIGLCDPAHASPFSDGAPTTWYTANSTGQGISIQAPTAACYWKIIGPACTQVQFSFSGLGIYDSTCNAGCTKGGITISDNFGTPVGPSKPGVCTPAPAISCGPTTVAPVTTTVKPTTTTTVASTTTTTTVAPTTTTVKPITTTTVASTTTVAPTTATTSVSTCCPAGQLGNPRSNSCIRLCDPANASPFFGGTPTTLYTANSTGQGIVIQAPTAACYWEIIGPDCTQVQFSFSSLGIYDSTCNAGCTKGGITISDNFGTPVGPYCCQSDRPALSLTSNKALMIVDLPADGELDFEAIWSSKPGACTPAPAISCGPTTVAPVTTTVKPTTTTTTTTTTTVKPTTTTTVPSTTTTTTVAPITTTSVTPTPAPITTVTPTGTCTTTFTPVTTCTTPAGATTTLIIPTTTTATKCPSASWIYDPSTSKCYLYVDANKGASTAETYCKSLGTNGHLVQIKSAVQNTLVNKIIRDIKGGNGVAFWIGVQNIAMNNVFKYMDNTALTYSNWLPTGTVVNNGATITGKEPNSLYAYVVSNSWSSATNRDYWAAKDSTLQLPSMCELPVV